MDKNKRSLQELITRVGDQGADKYKANIQKLLDTISKDLENAEFKQQLYDAFSISISKIPNKYFVYAVIVSNLSQTLPEFAEKLFSQLFDLLQTFLQNNDILEASNIMCFFAETVNTGLMNSFTFISLLMEIITVSEKDTENFDSLIRLVFKSVLYVKAHLVEKYEMEYANLMEDVKRIIEKHARETPDYNIQHITSLIDPLSDPSVRPAFRIYAEDCKEFIRNVKPVRQNYKLVFSVNGPKKNISTLPELRIFEQEFGEMRAQNKASILNEFLIREYIKDSLLAFGDNIVLFVEKVFVVNFGHLEIIKNFAFLDICYSILMNSHYFKTNQTFACIMEIMIKYFNFEIFFENSLTKFSRYLSGVITKLSIIQLQTIITNLALVNYLTSKSYSLQFDNREVSEATPYFDFLQFYKSLKQSLANQTHPVNKTDLNK